MKYQDIPILILGYNRPHHIKKLINSLKKLKPKKIFISLDGPKYNLIDQKKSIDVKKEIEKINWNCSIKKKYSKYNLGCRISVSNGIDWFFKFNRFGIILEDDCIPNKSFFLFCRMIDKKYKNNNRIFSISGSNFYNLYNNNLYFFSKYNHCWGWASWQRAWKHNDKKLSFWKKWKYTKNWKNYHNTLIERKYWEKIFDKVYKKKIDSWAYVWTCSMWKQNGLTVIPKRNLIKNIGFDMSATNTIVKKKVYRKVYNLNVKDIKKLKTQIIPLNENDKYVFENHFEGKYYLWPWILIKGLKLFFLDPQIFFLKLNKIIFK